MDIEGAEQRALAGAQDTLRTYKPRLAIAAYHLEDDQIKIPEIVAATRPDYEMECGPCGFDRGWIVPSTLLFPLITGNKVSLGRIPMTCGPSAQYSSLRRQRCM